ncbi:MAG: sugar phosphate isomerase/epimerase family protein [Armatimonadia bacterium]|jgi:sugar phosphate isomerase/epimerase
MKLGMVTYQVAKDWDLGTMIEMCQKTGFQGVELRTTHAHGVELDLPYQDRAAVRKRFEDSGIVLWCLGSTCEYHSDNPEIVAKNIEETKEWLRLADEVGAASVKVRPNSFVEGVEEEYTLRQIGEALRECGDFAAGLGVKITLEVHGRGTQAPCHIRTIMDVCNHPMVGVTWNCNMGEVVNGSIKTDFDLLAPWIWSAHIHDLYEDYPYHEFIRLLKGINFDGFCLIELPESCEAERFLKYYSLLWKEWTK